MASFASATAWVASDDVVDAEMEHAADALLDRAGAPSARVAGRSTPVFGSSRVGGPTSLELVVDRSTIQRRRLRGRAAAAADIAERTGARQVLHGGSASHGHSPLLAAAEAAARAVGASSRALTPSSPPRRARLTLRLPCDAADAPAKRPVPAPGAGSQSARRAKRAREGAAWTIGQVPRVPGPAVSRPAERKSAGATSSSSWSAHRPAPSVPVLAMAGLRFLAAPPARQLLRAGDPSAEGRPRPMAKRARLAAPAALPPPTAPPGLTSLAQPPAPPPPPPGRHAFLSAAAMDDVMSDVACHIDAHMPSLVAAAARSRAAVPRPLDVTTDGDGAVSRAWPRRPRSTASLPSPTQAPADARPVSVGLAPAAASSSSAGALPCLAGGGPRRGSSACGGGSRSDAGSSLLSCEGASSPILVPSPRRAASSVCSSMSSVSSTRAPRAALPCVSGRAGPEERAEEAEELAKLLSAGHRGRRQFPWSRRGAFAVMTAVISGAEARIPADRFKGAAGRAGPRDPGATGRQRAAAEAAGGAEEARSSSSSSSSSSAARMGGSGRDGGFFGGAQSFPTARLPPSGGGEGHGAPSEHTTQAATRPAQPGPGASPVRRSRRIAGRQPIDLGELSPALRKTLVDVTGSAGSPGRRRRDRGRWATSPGRAAGNSLLRLVGGSRRAADNLLLAAEAIARDPSTVGSSSRPASALGPAGSPPSSSPSGGGGGWDDREGEESWSAEEDSWDHYNSGVSLVRLEGGAAPRRLPATAC